MGRNLKRIKEITMDLLLTLDENYLLPCRVMLDSFFTSNPGEENVSVYLLHSGIPAGKLEELAGFCSGFGAELKPMTVDTALFESAPTSKRYPKEMYYRLLSPLILPRNWSGCCTGTRICSSSTRYGPCGSWICTERPSRRPPTRG